MPLSLLDRHRNVGMSSFWTIASSSFLTTSHFRKTFEETGGVRRRQEAKRTTRGDIVDTEWEFTCTITARWF